MFSSLRRSDSINLISESCLLLHIWTSCIWTQLRRLSLVVEQARRGNYGEGLFGIYQKECNFIFVMSQIMEKTISQVKIQGRMSDLVKDEGGKNGSKAALQIRGENGVVANSFVHCQQRSAPKIKVDEATMEEIEKKNLHQDGFANLPKLEPEKDHNDEGSDRIPSRRRQSVGSSIPARKESNSRKEEEEEEERPFLRKCLSLRKTRRQGRSRGVEENKIVRWEVSLYFFFFFFFQHI